MKFAHSYWNGPAKDGHLPSLGRNKDKLYQQLVYSAVGVEYIHKFGYNIELFIPDGLVPIFHVIPYDMINVITIPEGTSSAFWAQSKFHALKEMGLGDVHIDGDFWIRDKAFCDSVASFKTDVIVQNIDGPRVSLNGANRIARRALTGIPMPYGLDNKDTLTVNCGLVGFNNADLKGIYLDQYLTILENCKDVIFGKNVSPDLVVEQDNLYKLIKQYNHTYTTVVPGLVKGFDEGIFSHFIGDSKKKCIEEAETLLKEMNPVVLEDIRYVIDELPDDEEPFWVE